MYPITSINDIIMGKARGSGDGMESVETVSEHEKKPESEPFNLIQSNPNESFVKGRLVQVYPTKVFTNDKNKFYAKPPKFVPYEPYPGAVKPIHPKTIPKSTMPIKNRMDINTLVSQMSQMNTNLNEFKPSLKRSTSQDKTPVQNTNQDDELQKKIDALTKENETLNEQLKQQVQVNKDLKTMLVASMEEGLETQVQSLHEDKKHLANALVNSAQHLSLHQEQTEWLAGQCEVWRSKFLASRLVIEELAACKKILNEKTANLQHAITQLLDERCRVRNMMICTYQHLYSLHERWLENVAMSEYIDSNNLCNRPIGNLHFSATLPNSTNVLDMALVNMKLSENIASNVHKQDISHLDMLPSTTDGEKFAEQAIAMPKEEKILNEGPVNALVQHANNSGNIKIPISTCVHCTGKVQLL